MHATPCTGPSLGSAISKGPPFNSRAHKRFRRRMHKLPQACKCPGNSTPGNLHKLLFEYYHVFSALFGCMHKLLLLRPRAAAYLCILMHARPGPPGARELKGGPLEIADPREGPVHGVACISLNQVETYARNPVHKSKQGGNLCTQPRT